MKVYNFIIGTLFVFIFFVVAYGCLVEHFLSMLYFIFSLFIIIPNIVIRFKRPSQSYLILDVINLIAGVINLFPIIILVFGHGYATGEILKWLIILIGFNLLLFVFPFITARINKMIKKELQV